MRERINLLHIGKAVSVAFLLVYAPILRAQNSGDATAWLQHLAAELHKLTAQLLEHRLEFQELRSSMLERELADIRKQQERLVSQVNAHARQVAQVDQELAAPSLTQDERSQLEAARIALTGQEAQRLSSERSVLTGKETEIQARYNAARQHVQTLRQMAQQLNLKPAGGSQ